MGLSPALGHPPLLPSPWGAGWPRGAPWGAAQHGSIPSPCFSSLLRLVLRQGLKGFPGLPGPRGAPGLPVSGAANAPRAKIWVPCSPKFGSEVLPCCAVGLAGCWHCWRSCDSWAAANVTSIVTVTQGLAGPPGPSGPPLMLSGEELRVSAWGRGLPIPALAGATRGGKGLTVMLPHVPLLLRSFMRKDQGPCTKSKQIWLIPLPSRLSLSPACPVPSLST